MRYLKPGMSRTEGQWQANGGETETNPNGGGAFIIIEVRGKR